MYTCNGMSSNLPPLQHLSPCLQVGGGGAAMLSASPLFIKRDGPCVMVHIVGTAMMFHSHDIAWGDVEGTIKLNMCL